MDFTLTYRGPLSSNGGPQEKQVLRRHFHKQLKELWAQPPLKGRTTSATVYRPLYEDVIEQVGLFRFVPLVTNRFAFTARIRVTFLRPGYPGQLVGTGGDIDNRIKTLLDALAKPPESDSRRRSPRARREPILLPFAGRCPDNKRIRYDRSAVGFRK